MTVPVSLLPAAAPTTAGTTGPTAPDDVFASLLAALSGALGLPLAPGAQEAPPEGVPSPTAAAQPTGHTGVTTVPASPAHGPSTAPEPGLPAPASPVAWTAVTQRPVLPSAVPDAAAPAPVTTTAPVTTPVLVAQVVGEGAPTPAQPAHTAPAPAALDAPGHVERTETASHGASVRAVTPAAEQAPRPDGVGHAVPEAAHAAADGSAPVAPVDVPPAAPMQVVEAAPVTATAAPSAPARPDAAPATTTTHHVRPALVEAARGLRHEGGGRTSLVVRLDPPELGAVLVRLTVQDGRVDVTLRTPDLAARADLQAQSYDVEQVLRDQGFDLASFDVLHGDVLSGGHGDAPDRGTPDRSRRADGHPAHPPVTDDGPAPEPDGTWL